MPNIPEIKARYEAATRLPWRKMERDRLAEPAWIISGGMEAPLGKLIAVAPSHQGNDISPREHQANADFIVRAVNNHAALVTALEEAQKLLEDCSDTHNWYVEGEKSGEHTEDCLGCRIATFLGEGQ